MVRVPFPALALVAVVAAPPGPARARVADEQPHTRAATEALARRDLASRLKVAESQVEVLETTERTWPDQALGCGGRKPLAEPVPTAGFAITLSHAGKTYAYHADRRGRVVRCDAPGKPVAPISR